MPLESGELDCRPPMGKGTTGSRRYAESLRRPLRVDDRGGGPLAVPRSDREVLSCPVLIPPQQRTPPAPVRRSAHRARRRCHRDHAQGHRCGLPRRARRKGASRGHSRRADRRRPGPRPRPAPAARHRGAGARRTARDGRRQHRRGVDDRAGLLRHADPAGVEAQHPREPRLVHRVHAVSAGDQPGQARGAAELPDDGRGTDRPRGRQRLDARRGHRRRRGDDADAPRGQGFGEPARRRHRRLPRRPPRCWPPAPRRSASRSSPPTCATDCPTATSSA